VRFYEAGKSWDVAEVTMLKNNPHVNLMDYVSSAGSLYQNIKL